MMLEEWATRVDALAAAAEPSIAPHARERASNDAQHETEYGTAGMHPTWRHDGRSAWVRESEDGGTLRFFFRPRGEADTAVPDEEQSREKTYLRGEAGAREAAADLVRFFTTVA